MRKRLFWAILPLCVFFGGQLSGDGRLADEKPSVRQPAVAGQFYPAQPDELRRMLDDYLAQAAVPRTSGELGGADCAARGLHLFRQGGCAQLRAAQRPKVRAGGGDCALSFRGLPVRFGLRRRCLRHAARECPGGQGVRRQAGQVEPAHPAFQPRPHANPGAGRACPRGAAPVFAARAGGLQAGSHRDGRAKL